MVKRDVLAADGTRLVVEDFGGDGRDTVLCLHGLAGYAGEWAGTAERLSDLARVVAFDARGHGRSDRLPADVSRSAHVADAVSVIESLRLAPVVVVGHSLGGQTALLLAAARPDLVRGLVVVEASPDSGDGDAYVQVENSLRSWPTPFADHADAVAFFRSRGFPAQPWADGLEQREDGWWPRFDVELLARTVREADSRTYWAEWESIRCPIRVVRGANGSVPAAHARLITSRAHDAELVQIAGAGHDLHLERPHEWAKVVRRFLRSLG